MTEQTIATEIAPLLQTPAGDTKLCLGKAHPHQPCVLTVVSLPSAFRAVWPDIEGDGMRVVQESSLDLSFTGYLSSLKIAVTVCKLVQSCMPTQVRMIMRHLKKDANLLGLFLLSFNQ